MVKDISKKASMSFSEKIKNQFNKQFKETQEMMIEGDTSSLKQQYESYDLNHEKISETIEEIKNLN